MINLNVNGKKHEVESDPDVPLLWVIREHLKLTGTKYGCGIAQCGACTVHIDGKPERSCQVPVKDIDAVEHKYRFVRYIERTEGIKIIKLSSGRKYLFNKTP